MQNSYTHYKDTYTQISFIHIKTFKETQSYTVRESHTCITATRYSCKKLENNIHGHCAKFNSDLVQRPRKEEPSDRQVRIKPFMHACLHTYIRYIFLPILKAVGIKESSTRRTKWKVETYWWTLSMCCEERTKKQRLEESRRGKEERPATRCAPS